jgi:two-component system chemotaxis sensor kinase CheA
MDELLEQFLIEARELTAQAADDFSALARDPADAERIDSAFRAIHTLKGSVAIFDMAPAERALHVAEDLLAQARTGRQLLSAGDVATLIALIDQTDRWVDAMERDGALDTAANREADSLVARLDPAPHVAADAGDQDWFSRLKVRDAAALAGATTNLIAFRYRPDADCFFRGEDPLATVRQVPGLVALAVLPITQWPSLAELEPFQCALTIEGVSRASETEIRAAFHLVSDQVDLVAIPASTQPRDDLPTFITNAAASLRVDVSRIDALADGVGELIIANNRLAHIANDVARSDPRLGALVRDAQAGLERAVSAMREAITAVRMTPLGPSLQRLPRLVREMADTLGKSVSFEMRGERTEVDKGIADQLFEPLLHIVRNALDHGLESAEVRRAAGKPEAGRLSVEVTRDGDHVVVAVSDDGAGIDVEGVKATAVRRGLLTQEAADLLDDGQAMRLIFAAGFSTAAVVTTISGRGVGMDAVQAAADRLGGRVEISSVARKGATISLRLPLNAIMTRLLIVRAGGERYGVPLDRIVETTSLATAGIHAVGMGRACVLRDRTLPVLSLSRLLGKEDMPAPIAKLLVTETVAERVGLVVDGFDERIDGLVRPRSGLLASVPGIAGTTLMGDGGVLLVLDLAELIG